MAGWYGVDLDGTLALYEPYSYVPGIIGPPVPRMLERVKAWLAMGREVRIVTARAADPWEVEMVETWLEIHVGVKLQVTNQKDYGMIELWDDRAVQVIPNIGRRADGGGDEP